MSPVYADISNANESPKRIDRRTWLAFTLILSFAAFLRLDNLGEKSLWHDEFAAWHVSRLPLADSLRWGPELTKPPLYQLILRVITTDSHPSEATLRLPAALCGILCVWAAWWMGKTFAGQAIAFALAALMAFQPLHIDYSQEARPYTMLVLGSIVTTTLWYHTVTKPSLRTIAAYIVTATLTFHAHYLFVLTMISHALWWVITILIRSCFPHSTPQSTPDGPPINLDTKVNPTANGAPIRKASFGLACHPLTPVLAQFITGLLCTPQVLHYLKLKTTTFPGLDWIEPPTASRVLETLERLTFNLRPAGWIWLFALLLPSLGWMLIQAVRRPTSHVPLRGTMGGMSALGRTCSSLAIVHAPETLLTCWLLCSFGGLLVISWLAQPAFVNRYALPATIPALLIPLIMIHRLNPRAAAMIAAVFLLTLMPDSLFRDTQPRPGFRELSMFLNDQVDPEREAVVLAFDATSDQQWSDLDRLAFRYYPLKGQPVHDLPIRPEPDTSTPILHDPRTLYIVTFRADPVPTLLAANRHLEPFNLESSTYSQLLFAPYRILRAAPLQPSLPNK